MAKWYVLTTLPQREFKAERELSNGLGLHTLVPYEIRHRKSLAKGNKPVMMPYKVPLMPGYLFAGSSDDLPWYDIRAIRDIRGSVQFGGIHATLTDLQMARIRAMAADTRNETRKGLTVGDKVSITDGPFRSLDGLVEAIGLGGVTVTFTMFSRPMAVKIRPDQIERAA